MSLTPVSHISAMADYIVDTKTGTIWHKPSGWAACVIDPEAKVPVLSAHYARVDGNCTGELTPEIKNGFLPAWRKAQK